MACRHPSHKVVVASKVDSAHDICRCTECGATGHRVPLFLGSECVKPETAG